MMSSKHFHGYPTEASVIRQLASIGKQSARKPKITDERNAVWDKWNQTVRWHMFCEADPQTQKMILNDTRKLATALSNVGIAIAFEIVCNLWLKIERELERDGL